MSATLAAMLIGMVKPMPSLPLLPVTIAELIPITSPFMLTSGPPELPRLIGASVWMNDSYSLMPTAVPLEGGDDAGRDALAQAERGADGHDQLADLQLAAVALGERRIARVVDLDHGDVGLLVGADHLRLGLDAVPERDGDLVGVFDDVVVGQDVAVVVVHEARAEARGPESELLPLRCPTPGPKNRLSISSKSRLGSWGCRHCREGSGAGSGACSAG